MRNLILILSAVFLIIASFFFFKNTSPTVIKYRVQNEIFPADQNIINTPGGGGGGDGGGGGGGVGGGGGDSDLKHSEVFAFTEPDPNNSIRHDIFIYDSATGEKKQLTGNGTDKNKSAKEYNINPKFSADGNKIYFANVFDCVINICSMDLNGNNFMAVLDAGKTNFSVSGTRIIYVGSDKKVRIYEADKNKFTVLVDVDRYDRLDFPMLSKDGNIFYFVSKSSNGYYEIYGRRIVKKQKYLETQALLLSGYGRIAGIELSPDDKFLLITFGTNVFQIFDIDKKEIIRVVSSDKDSKVVGATWSDDGKSVYWIRNSPYKNIAKFNIEGPNEDMTSDVIVPNFSGYFVSLKPTIGNGGGTGGDGGGSGGDGGGSGGDGGGSGGDGGGSGGDGGGSGGDGGGSGGDGGGSGGAGVEPDSFVYAAQVLPHHKCAFIFAHTPSTNTKIQLTGTEKDPNFNQISWDSDPKYSPDGKTIAFCRSKDKLDSKYWIYTMKEDGSDIFALVQVNSRHNFSFSSDSKTLFYVSPDYSINSINLETRTDKRITNDFSLDKYFPIYIEEPETGSKYIYYFVNDSRICLNRISLDDNTVIKIVFDQFINEILSVNLSPDSSKILFSTTNSGANFIFDLKSKTLTPIPVLNNMNTLSVFWSNDGKSVYFYFSDPYKHLVKYDVDKFNVDSMTIVLENLPHIYGISLKPVCPSSSGSGGSVARNEILIYSENQGLNNIIVSHDLFTGIKTELSGNCDENFEDTSPKISPDGKIILFCRKLSSTHLFKLYFVNIDEKTCKEFGKFSLNNCDFNFSNDGKTLILKRNFDSLWSIEMNGDAKNLNIYGSHPTTSVDGEFLYYVNENSLYKHNLFYPEPLPQLVLEFQAQIQDFRLSPDGKFASVIYSNIVTVISCDGIAGSSFYPILDDECPLEDAIWSHDSKWLYIRRGLPKQDLIKISTSNYDITLAEVVLENLVTDSIIQILTASK